MAIRIPEDVDFSTFPTGDGEPMAETETHRVQLVNLIVNFTSLTASHPRVYVGGNMLMYYTRGYGRDHVSADVFVTFDVPRGVRRKWEIWNEGGRFADVIVEVTSPSTYREDLGKKRRLYARLGVQELYLYDPEQQVRPFYRGYRLIGHELVDMAPPVNGAYYSEVLGAELRVIGHWLRVIDPATGLPFPLVEELEHNLSRAEQQRRNAEAERRREAVARKAAEEREQRAEEERQREAVARKAAEEREQRAEEERQREATARRAAEEREQRAEAALRAALAELARLRGEHSEETGSLE